MYLWACVCLCHVHACVFILVCLCVCIFSHSLEKTLLPSLLHSWHVAWCLSRLTCPTEDCVPSSQLLQGLGLTVGWRLHLHPSAPPEASFQWGECLAGIWATPQTQWGPPEMPFGLRVGNLQRGDTWTTSTHSLVAQQVVEEEVGVPEMSLCPPQLLLCLGKSLWPSLHKEWFPGNFSAAAHLIWHYDVGEANTDVVASVCGLWPWKRKRSRGGSGEIWKCMEPEASVWRIITMEVCGWITRYAA